MKNKARGQIITFYSYKGGTGRTMALANIACLLAERQQGEGGKDVLIIDWDLEAPGLHRYFRNRLAGRKLSVDPLEDPFGSQPGLIDLFYELDKKTDYYNEYKHKVEGGSDLASRTLSSEKLARTTIDNVNLQEYIVPTTLKGLSLLKAGRFNSEDPNEYSERVNKFNWEALYKKSPHLIRMFAETLAERYAYVLIDSRTGVTDISGICTMLLPEKLVVVFTPNIQSLKGGLDLIHRATDYRKESADLRPLLVFPLVSRVEANEPDLRYDWRFGNLQHDTVGYQLEFEKLLTEVYEKKEIKLTKYFDVMQIQHIPRYAYGEEIAVLVEKIGDKFSLRQSYQTFASKLVEYHVPWEGEIKELDSSHETTTKVSSFADWLLGALRSGSTRKSIRMTLVSIIILVALLGTTFSFYQSQKAQRYSAALVQEQQRTALLQQQLSELQQPLQLIKAKDDKINALYEELNQVSMDRDAAKQDALAARTQASSALRIADQAKQQAQQANQQYQDTLRILNKCNNLLKDR